MKNIKVAIVVGTLALVTSACRTKAILVPEAQVETPEVAGRRGSLALRADVTPARSVSPIRFPDEQPPSTRLRTEENTDALTSLGAEVGVGPQVEIGAILGSGLADRTGCGGISAKVQAFGPSRATARAGDTSMGVSAHGYYCSSYENGSVRSTGEEYKERSDSQSIDLGASIGYHARDMLMVYGGLAFATHHAMQKVTQDGSSNFNTPSMTSRERLDGTSQSYALGLEYGGPTMWVNLRYNFAHSNYDYINPDHHTAAVGAGYGF